MDMSIISPPFGRVGWSLACERRRDHSRTPGPPVEGLRRNRLCPFAWPNMGRVTGRGVHRAPDDWREAMIRCRGIRGATTATANSPEAILAATRELLTQLVARNAIAVEVVTSAFFTVTDDLDAAYPARAARELGWRDVALL